MALLSCPHVFMQDSTRLCVTAAVVRYETHGRRRHGIATTFLQDRLDVGESCPVFISHNPNFRLPDDQSLPIIMIGPGAGLAPFRAFIQERSNISFFSAFSFSNKYLKVIGHEL